MPSPPPPTPQPQWVERDINLVQRGCFSLAFLEIEWSLQHLFGSNSSALILTVVPRRFSCILFLAFVLTENTRENILSTKALLIGVIRHLRAKMASFLNAWCWSTAVFITLNNSLYPSCLNSLWRDQLGVSNSKNPIFYGRLMNAQCQRTTSTFEYIFSCSLLHRNLNL